LLEVFTMKKKAVFLDRDGNINRDVGYPGSYDMIEIYPFSYEAVRKINRAGMLAVVITNQSGIGRGLIDEDVLRSMHDQLRRDFTRRNARLDAIYYCPHYPESELSRYRIDCSCRKPKPGLALQAAADLNIDLSRSYMIGDKVEDIKFGWNIHAIPILVLTGYGEKSRKHFETSPAQPAYTAQNLLDAVNWIMERECVK
jgi:D-glycero-D-manno-heptose 1,7-bisphosphate phosphatase